MYCRTVKYMGYSVTICCMPDTPESELQKRAKATVERAIKGGLVDKFLVQYLNGAKSFEYCMTRQKREMV